MTKKGQNREAFAYGSIIETLSQGLYPDKKHVIRELVQNAYDGLCDLKRKDAGQSLKPIQIKVEDSSIFVGDSGIGMTEQKMTEYRYLGFSQKVIGQDAGFRGIGKFSPISLCKRIIVDSSPIGVAKRFRVVIDAEGMRARVKKERNPPLEDLLSKHTSLEEASEADDAHYTFVELEGVKSDAKTYLDVASLNAYLSQTAPISFDPKFKYSDTIDKRLRKYVPDYLPIELTVNGKPVYKNFIEPCTAPRDTFVWDETDKVLLAYAWSCANEQPGIFEVSGLTLSSDKRHPSAGLVFKVKNISVGDRFLPRKTFWKTSPELSFHFFGEIHVLDAGVIPSSDRNDFEDNTARQTLYNQCAEIARDLNLVRRTESSDRNFDKAVDAVNTTVKAEEKRLAENALPIELKDEAKYTVRNTVENLKKRLDKSRDPRRRKVAKAAVKRGEKLLVKLNSSDAQGKGLVDITEVLKFNSQCTALYAVITRVLREEFQYDPKRLERLIKRIHEALKAAKI